MQVFITGGTGLIGSRLVKRLMERRDRPVVLTRHESTAEKLFGKSCRIVEDDSMKAGAWQDVAAECEAVVNLAGENLFNHRWNDQFKALLTNSRLQTTTHVVEAMNRKPRREDGTPKVLVNASAIGIYGPHGDEELTEESPPASDFLANLCVQWEKAARTVEEFGVRCALTRIGVVLAKEGGALKQMWTPFSLGMGGPVGDGRQWMSWIHIEDMVGVLLMALDNNGGRRTAQRHRAEPGYEPRFRYGLRQSAASAVVHADAAFYAAGDARRVGGRRHDRPARATEKDIGARL